jgi:hypothetical protein
LTAIHIEPPWFLLFSRFSLEDTPVEAISFQLFAENWEASAVNLQRGLCDGGRKEKFSLV